MTRQQVLSTAISQSREMMLRYLKGFDDSNHTKQAAGMPNHVAWTLGHLAAIMQGNLGRIEGRAGLPPEDFIADAARGDATRFGAKGVGFGSEPLADAAAYPGYARCVEVFERACQRLMDYFGNATDQQLDALTEFRGTKIGVWTVATRMAVHNGLHVGQVVDLRRGLGLGKVL